MNKKEIRKVVKVSKKKFDALWNAIKDRDAHREQKRRLISRKGISYLDRLNAILFEIQDDIKHAKKNSAVNQDDELHNLLVMLDHFRSKSIREQQIILDSLRVKDASVMTDL